MPLKATEGIEFWVGNPRTLDAGQRRDLMGLLRRSVKIDFPSRSNHEIDYLVDQMSGQMAHPNKSVGGPLLRKKQSYTRPVAVVASNQGEAVSCLLTANNASSSRPGPIGSLERLAKHHLGQDRFVESRWHWLGFYAANTLERGNVQQARNRGEITLPDVMQALTLEQRDDRQSTSSYPWQAEEHWKGVLEDWSFSDTGDPVSAIYAFGSNYPFVTQEHWTGPTAGDLQELILAKNGAEAAVTYAHDHLI